MKAKAEEQVDAAEDAAFDANMEAASAAGEAGYDTDSELGDTAGGDEDTQIASLKAQLSKLSTHSQAMSQLVREATGSLAQRPKHMKQRHVKLAQSQTKVSADAFDDSERNDAMV